jgi:hypothetical protein
VAPTPFNPSNQEIPWWGSHLVVVTVDDQNGSYVLSSMTKSGRPYVQKVGYGELEFEGFESSWCYVKPVRPTQPNDLVIFYWAGKIEKGRFNGMKSGSLASISVPANKNRDVVHLVAMDDVALMYSWSQKQND